VPGKLLGEVRKISQRMGEKFSGVSDASSPGRAKFRTARDRCQTAAAENLAPHAIGAQAPQRKIWHRTRSVRKLRREKFGTAHHRCETQARRKLRTARSRCASWARRKFRTARSRCGTYARENFTKQATPDVTKISQRMRGKFPSFTHAKPKQVSCHRRHLLTEYRSSFAK